MTPVEGARHYRRVAGQLAARELGRGELVHAHGREMDEARNARRLAGGEKGVQALVVGCGQVVCRPALQASVQLMTACVPTRIGSTRQGRLGRDRG